MQKEKFLENIELNIFESEPGSNLYQYRPSLEKIQNELKKFDLSQNQTKVYIYLAKGGPKTAPEIFKALSMPRTETYHILNSLQYRGIITTQFSSPVVYSALPLDEAILTLVNAEKEKVNILAKQGGQLIELWDEIPSFAMDKNDTKKEQLQMLQGAAQINTKMRQMINTAREQVKIFGTIQDLARFYHADFLDTLSNSIVDVKLIISPASKMPDFLKMMDKQRIKLMRNSKTENQCYVVKDSEILIFLRNGHQTADSLFAAWTDSKSLVESLDMLFNFCWEYSELIY